MVNLYISFLLFFILSFSIPFNNSYFFNTFNFGCTNTHTQQYTYTTSAGVQKETKIVSVPKRTLKGCGVDSVEDLAPESRVRTRRLDTQRQRSLAMKKSIEYNGDEEASQRKSNSTFYVSFE